jgi:hypothetical protein
MVAGILSNSRRYGGLLALIGLLALTGCVSVTHYDDDDGYYRCHNGRCYYHND